MRNIETIAASYYTAIDRSDIDHVLNMYAPDAVYDRAGFEYRDATAIRKYFSEERQISGEHTIIGMWSDAADSVVFVTGRFEGQDDAGTRKAFGFADLWRFNAQGLVSRRESYLALG